ncbi:MULTISPECIES: sodium:solute symporter family protein [unclassified Cellulophaga]|uniref:sodium:solute symporter family protein n=1 Tax=unclassified Cellulophaga TaxID=2634405 RepID=UPI0026E1C400|nr:MULTISPECIES: sodium:solute symporter family protein [unclassified Cellulophaga]MDO6492699.1 sodium:solute symporter family protein [Cellulophaga sp. 2_MG-2023]MDO6495956.1 sodium:solute symporter family protein [Cellulophaga sp. 3_MG-2023]
MGITDVSVIFIFVLLIFICGMSFSKTGKNMKSYFSAGGALPWWMSGLSLFMSFFSAGTFVVWGAIAYSSGWVAISIQWTMCISGLIIGFLIAPKWQKTKAITAAQFITDRLGYKTQRTYTYLFLLISIFTMGAFLYPVAKIVEVSTGTPIVASIVGLGILILIYTTVGGLWAVIVTDVLQFVVLTAVVLIVVPLSFDKIGGIEAFISKAPDTFFQFVNTEYSPLFLVAFGLYNLFFIAGNWAYVQRYTSVSTPKDAKKVGWLFGVLYAVCPLIWMLPPMVYRVLNPNLNGLENEGAYLLMCKEVLPVGMLGLMLGGMIFATSSSVNTTLNISAGVLTNDIYKHFKPNTPERKLVKIGKLATVLLGVITIIIALMVPYFGGIVEVVMSLAALTGGAMFLPPIWALFSKNQTGFTVLSVTIISLFINVFFKFFSPLLFNLKLDRALEMLLGVAVPIILLIACEIYFMLKPVKNLKYQEYKALIELKTTTETDSTSTQNKKGARVIGIGIALTGLIILILSFLAATGAFFVGTIGLLIGILGSLIIYKNLK